MLIQDSDLLLIEDTSGVSKKIAASKLKANLAANTYNNYKLLVNKPDYSSRFVYAQNMQASVAVDDYMMVERAGVSYKVTGQQIIDYFPSAPAGSAGPIVDVAGAGETVYETSTIANVANFQVSVVHNDGAGGTVIPRNYALCSGNQTTPFECESATSNGTGFTTGSLSTGAIEYGSSGSSAATKVKYTFSPSLSKDTLSYIRGGQNVANQPFTVQVNNETPQTFTTTSTYAGTPFQIQATSKNISSITIESPTNTSLTVCNFYDKDKTAVILNGSASLTFQSPNPNLEVFETGDVVQIVETGFDIDVASSGCTFSNNNFTVTGSTGAGARVAFGASRVKKEVLYFELTIDNKAGSEMFGVCTEYWDGINYAGSVSNNGCGVLDDGRRFGEGNWEINTNAPTLQSGNVLGFAIQAETGAIWMSENGAWVGPSPVLDSTDAYFKAKTPTDYDTYYPWIRAYSSNMWTINAAPVYPVPNGFTFSAGAAMKRCIGTDLSTNTMVVEGGAWQGSDGSSSGDAADGETTVIKTLPYDNQLTLGSNANLDLFTSGDAIHMVDDNGDKASYTPVTSTIANVNAVDTPYMKIYTNDALSTARNFPTIMKPSNLNSSDRWVQSALANSNATPQGGGEAAKYVVTFNPPIKTGGQFNLYCAYDDPDNGGDFYKPYINGQVVSNAVYDDGSSSNKAKNSVKTVVYVDEIVSISLSRRTYFYGIEVFGKIFDIDSNAVYADLAFASPNKDLKYFNPGDVVQGDFIPSQIYSANPGNDWIGYGGGSTYGVEQAFTGSTLNNAQSQQPRATIAFTNFPVGKIGLIVDSGAIDDPLVFYEINGTPINSSNTISSSWITSGKILYEFNTEVALTSIVQVSSNSSSSKALYGITINGDILIDGQPVDLNSVLVVSTDIAANTMTVDGGTWANGDVVTAPAMSGTGNFTSNTGPVVDVTNSNQQWVDNDNRLGESFFIKSASTRTGLAVLRAKAINEAKDWKTKTPYQAQSFVTYRGHYWVSQSGEPTGRPSGKSEHWIELGPVE